MLAVTFRDVERKTHRKHQRKKLHAAGRGRLLQAKQAVRPRLASGIATGRKNLFAALSFFSQYAKIKAILSGGGGTMSQESGIPTFYSVYFPGRDTAVLFHGPMYHARKRFFEEGRGSRFRGTAFIAGLETSFTARLDAGG